MSATLKTWSILRVPHSAEMRFSSEVQPVCFECLWMLWSVGSFAITVSYVQVWKHARRLKLSFLNYLLQNVLQHLCVSILQRIISMKTWGFNLIDYFKFFFFKEWYQNNHNGFVFSWNSGWRLGFLALHCSTACFHYPATGRHLTTSQETFSYDHILAVIRVLCHAAGEEGRIGFVSSTYHCEAMTFYLPGLQTL